MMGSDDRQADQNVEEWSPETRFSGYKALNIYALISRRWEMTNSSERFFAKPVDVLLTFPTRPSVGLG